ncbi:hypothetical protein D3C78_952610 [compost metagenome]
MHGVGVIVDRQLALLEGLTRQTNRSGLRERADGGGRERRQLQSRTLLFDAFGERRLTLAIRRTDGADACLHLSLVNAWRLGAASCNRTTFSQSRLYLGRLRIVQGIAQHSDFATLLHGKRQPAFQLGIEFIFTLKVHRAVQQRTGTADPQVVAKAFLGKLQLCKHRLQFAAPDVATVDQAHRENLVDRQAVQHLAELIRRAHRVDVQALHRQADSQAEVVLQAAEVGRQQFFQR